jgi:hypothetical protein
MRTADREGWHFRAKADMDLVDPSTGETVHFAAGLDHIDPESWPVAASGGLEHWVAVPNREVNRRGRRIRPGQVVELT